MCGIAGISGSIAEILTIPFDTVKVRMQINQAKYRTITQSLFTIAKEEGPRAYFQGITYGIIR